MSIRLKSTEKTPACVSMRAFLQPISARIYFGKTASHRKRARFVQSRGASPQAYWMSVKAAQRRGCAKRAFCGVCFLMPGGLKAGRCLRVDKPHPCHSEPVTRADRVVRPYKLGMTALCAVIRCGNAFSRRERQKNRAGGAPLALFPYGAGDRTRTGTLSPAVDFESTTSTNSITPADATRTLYRKRCGIAR